MKKISAEQVYFKSLKIANKIFKYDEDSLIQNELEQIENIEDGKPNYPYYKSIKMFESLNNDLASIMEDLEELNYRLVIFLNNAK